MSNIYEESLNELLSGLFNSEDVIDDISEECTSYSFKGKFKKTFMKSNNLYKYFNKYIKQLLSNNLFKTDPNNNIELHRCYNCLYIDLDYYIPEYVSKNVEINKVRELETGDIIQPDYKLPYFCTQYSRINLHIPSCPRCLRP